ncbi:site-specific DNA-methyltransferase [Pedobacter sp. ASV1-7]|uniref:DNA-methyltransferase n=1 Tax=Pedobacter sp. ASV1-7 TaxID=3145237 RepID=UPI0032E90272
MKKEIRNLIIHGDCLLGLKGLETESVDCCVTSPPYWKQRDYGVAGQYGQEKTPEDYLQNLAAVFSEVYRVLRCEGTLWLNMGDAYWNAAKGDGLKPKDLIGLPWQLAFKLRQQGWYLRQDIIWHKPNAMPESVRGRCGKAHEYLFLLTKESRYYFNHLAIRKPAKTFENRPFGVVRDRALDYNSKQRILRPNVRRGDTSDLLPPVKLVNKRSVWTVNTRPYLGAHTAAFPQELVKDCILAGTLPGGIVLDPFMGSGTTAVTARKLGRDYLGFELNPQYVYTARKRLEQLSLKLNWPTKSK